VDKDREKEEMHKGEDRELEKEEMENNRWQVVY